MLKSIFAFLWLFVATGSLAFAASDQWIEVSSSHFDVLTNSNEKQARHLVDQFERMRWVFQTLFPKTNADPASPIIVLAGKNAKTFQSVEPQAYLAKGQINLAGLFLATQDHNYILLRLDGEQENPFATVYHEYTHLQFRSAGEWMPIWLNEGLAEFFQNTEFRDKEVLLGEPSADDILYLRQQSLIPLPVLFNVDASSPYYHQEQKGSVFYAESWALTHYLMIRDRQNKTSAVTEYMNLMSHHEDPVVAAQKAFGDLKQLQQALQAYIQASRYMQFVLHTAAAPIDESTFTVKPVAQVDVDATRADILAAVQREKEARDLADSILKSDPNNVRAREAMGAIEFRAGNRGAARKWYGEAVKLDSNSYLANYYFAALSLESSGGEDPAIESSLRAAIQLNPKFAPAYDSLASLESRQHPKLADAFALENNAVKLDPSNMYYRLNVSSILTSLGQYDDATNVLQAALRLARTPSEASLVQTHISELEKFAQAHVQAEKNRRDFEAQQTHVSSQPNSTTTSQVIPITVKLKHPSEANGPKHSFIGVMHAVSCSYPTVLEFSVEGAKETIQVYSNDFSKISLTAIGVTHKEPMNPCEDFDGKKARVQYAETVDKTVNGQVFAVELRK
jgi:tetratricopeptide (TPR) repeat protein